jgi:hypothetical protein
MGEEQIFRLDVTVHHGRSLQARGMQASGIRTRDAKGLQVEHCDMATCDMATCPHYPAGASLRITRPGARAKEA